MKNISILLLPLLFGMVPALGMEPASADENKGIEKVRAIMGANQSKELSPTLINMAKNFDYLRKETPILLAINLENDVLNILSDLIKKEHALNEAGYFTFIHAQKRDFYFPEKLYTFLRGLKNKAPINNFIFLHLKDSQSGCIGSAYEYAQKYFLKNFGATYGLAKDKLLFMNYALFANIRRAGCCSFTYLTGNYNIKTFSSGFSISASDVCNLLGYSFIAQSYKEELQNLEDEYKKLSRYGNLMLVAIPKERVNDFVYPALPFGPKKKVFIKGIGYTDDMQLIMHALLEKPETIDSEDVEFCLVMTQKNGGLDPNAGIVIHPLISGDSQKLAELQKREEALFNKIFAQVLMESLKPQQVNKKIQTSLNEMHYEGAGILPYAKDEHGEILLLVGSESQKSDQVSDCGGIKDAIDNENPTMTAVREGAEELMFIFDNEEEFKCILDKKEQNAFDIQNTQTYRYLHERINNQKDSFSIMHNGYRTFFVSVPYMPEIAGKFAQRKKQFCEKVPHTWNEKSNLLWLKLSDVFAAIDAEVSSNNVYVPSAQGNVHLFSSFVESLKAAKKNGVVCMHFNKANGDNLYEVQSNALYRSKTLESQVLSKCIKKNEIKTILNLREENPSEEWYQNEMHIAKMNNIGFKTVPLYPFGLPSKKQLQQIFQVFEQAQKPILVHCLRGADRTGLVCALWVLETMGGSLEQAIQQLDSFYKHEEWLLPHYKFLIKWWHEERKKYSLQELLNRYNGESLMEEFKQTFSYQPIIISANRNVSSDNAPQELVEQKNSAILLERAHARTAMIQKHLQTSKL